MGNRGVITFASQSEIEKFIDKEAEKMFSLAGAPLRGFTEANPDKMGIYLHWNGGVSSIRAFLEAAKRLEIRDGVSDNSYCIARMAQMIGNFFGGTLSLGISTLNRLNCDNYDNGVYVVDENWEIIGREFVSHEDKDEYDLENFVAEIIGDMPESYHKILS